MMPVWRAGSTDEFQRDSKAKDRLNKHRADAFASGDMLLERHIFQSVFFRLLFSFQLLMGSAVSRCCLSMG